MDKMIPLITCEIFFCQYVFEFVFEVDILEFNLLIQVDSAKQPVKRNSVGSGYVSHCWTSALDAHLDHCFVISKNVEDGAVDMTVLNETA